MKQLIIIRGIPGSGKSTLARELCAKLENASHYEADMYFMRNGKYEFDANKLPHAHGWCKAQVEVDLLAGKRVIVSNTFTTFKELRPYFELAKAHGIVPMVLLAQNCFTNVHGVPDVAMQRMKDRMVYDLKPLFDEIYG